MLNKAKIKKVERDLYNFCFYSFLLDNIFHNLLLVNNQFMKIERNYRHNFTTYRDKFHLVTVVWIKKITHKKAFKPLASSPAVWSKFLPLPSPLTHEEKRGEVWGTYFFQLGVHWKTIVWTSPKRRSPKSFKFSSENKV